MGGPEASGYRDPDVGDAMRAYRELRLLREELAKAREEAARAARLQEQNAELERRLREQAAETERRIREADAASGRRVRELQGLVGVPLAYLASASPEQVGRLLLEFQRSLSAEKMTPGQIEALLRPGAQAADRPPLDALLNPFIAALKALPPDSNAAPAIALLERLLKEAA